MLFTESPRVLYNKNPLIEVVCELRFPTILKISADAPVDFQERMRGKYPIYEGPGVSNYPGDPENMAPGIEGVSFNVRIGQTGHKFIDPNTESNVSLNHGALSYSCPKYTRWETFSEELFEAEKFLREIYSPAYYTRVGLRYKDLILRSEIGLEKAEWKDLFRPELLGLVATDEFSGHVSSFNSTVRVEMSEGAVLVLKHGVAKIRDTSEIGYLIDSDFFKEGRVEADELASILSGFNRASGEFFRWAIGRELHSALDPEPI